MATQSSARRLAVFAGHLAVQDEQSSPVLLQPCAATQRVVFARPEAHETRHARPSSCKEPFEHQTEYALLLTSKLLQSSTQQAAALGHQYATSPPVSHSVKPASTATKTAPQYARPVLSELQHRVELPPLPIASVSNQGLQASLARRDEQVSPVRGAKGVVQRGRGVNFSGKPSLTSLPTPFKSWVNQGWSPQVVVTSNDLGYELHMALPGVKTEDIRVVLRSGRKLQISGTRKPVAGKMVREELEFGPFITTWQLPYDVNLYSLRADVMDGVLTVKAGRRRAA